MSGRTLRVALVTDLFWGERGEERLTRRLAEARALDADLALLPELPLNRWSPEGRAGR